MLDDDAKSRGNLRRFVFSEMRKSQFRELLSARDADGNRPVVTALHSDPAGPVLDEVITVGGEANVVVGEADDALLIAQLCVGHGDDDMPNALRYQVDADETIIEFVHRAAISEEAARMVQQVRLGRTVRVTA